MNPNTVIFDLGGVLIDWNPRYLYRKIFSSEEEVTWFLENICTSAWNDEQDGGRSFEAATEELVRIFPEHELPIRAWYGRWQETISGPIHGTVDVLRAVRDNNRHRLYALTNWSDQTFPWALDNFEFLHWFEGIVVSGVEKKRKPFPEIYHILFERYGIEPNRAVYIDDNIKNIDTADQLGLQVVHFQHPEQLRTELVRLGVMA